MGKGGIDSSVGKMFEQCWIASAEHNSYSGAILAKDLTLEGMMDLIIDYGAQLRVSGSGLDVQQAWAKIRKALLLIQENSNG